MKNTFFLFFIVALFACKDATSPSSPLKGTSEDLKSSTTEAEIFLELVNAHRANLGLRSLIISDEMTEIALTHSQNMASGAVSLGHTGFSERCRLARTRLGGGNWCAENVAQGQNTVASVFESWLSSSGHRANIENARATHMGLGKARSVNGRNYWTQLLLEH